MANRFVSPQQQFFINPVTGAPLAGGFLYFYVSGTSTPLNTYSNPDLDISHVNTNPIELDSAGQAGAVFLQNLAYKVVLTDSTGVQYWTADPVWSSDYSTFAQFQPFAGNPNGLLAGVASTQGSLPGTSSAWDYVNNILYVCTSTGTVSTAVWVAVNSPITATFVPPPTGRLTPTSGTPVINTDVVGNTNLVYTPYNGNTVPIYNGTTFTTQTFTELTLTLTTSHAANTIYDVFVFNNSGVLTLVTGPAWTSSAAGTGARGTGASTTQISRISGIWTNTVQISGRNGATTYTVGAGLATYLGSIFIDATAGQISCYVSWGQSRKWAVWNAYNRVPITMQVGDSTASWSVSSSGRAANGDSANKATTFCGLPEETVQIQYTQRGQTSSSSGSSSASSIGVGINSTTVFSGKLGNMLNVISAGTINVQSDLVAVYPLAPSLGINNVQLMEALVSGTCALYGTNSYMLATMQYRG